MFDRSRQSSDDMPAPTSVAVWWARPRRARQTLLDGAHEQLDASQFSSRGARRQRPSTSAVFDGRRARRPIVASARGGVPAGARHRRRRRVDRGRRRGRRRDARGGAGDPGRVRDARVRAHRPRRGGCDSHRRHPPRQLVRDGRRRRGSLRRPARRDGDPRQVQPRDGPRSARGRGRRRAPRSIRVQHRVHVILSPPPRTGGSAARSPDRTRASPGPSPAAAGASRGAQRSQTFASPNASDFPPTLFATTRSPRLSPPSS